MSSSVLTILWALSVSTVLIAGNVIPISVEPFNERWVPTSDQRNSYLATLQPESIHSFPAYQPIRKNSTFTFGNVNYGDAQGLPDKGKLEKKQQVGHSFAKGSEIENTQASMLPVPKPRRDDVLQEKLGFSMLSSLLPTSILGSPQEKPEDTENLVETDSNHHTPFLGGTTGLKQLQQLLGHQAQSSNAGGYDISPSSSSEQSNSENSQEMDSDSGSSLFSRIRNAIPFGSGLLSGLLNNENNEEDTSSNENTMSESGTNFNFPNIPHNGFNFGASNATSLFSLNSDQLSMTNEDNYESESSDTGSSFLSSLPNPITGVRNFFGSIFTSSNDDVDTQQPASGGGYVDESNDPMDSNITPLQSLSEGSFNDVIRVIVPYLSHVVTALAPAKAKLPLIKLLGAVLGPMLATAIAAMVIGIVYVSIYVSASAIRNEDVEGEVFLLSIKQLMNILGIPDPLEELFDINVFRSIQGRSLNSKQSRIADSQVTPNYMGNITNQEDTCLQRLACHAIGKKLVGGRLAWKNGWIGRSISWIAGNVHTDSWSKGRQNNFYYKLIRDAKSIIDAIAVGMENKGRNIINDDDKSIESTCIKYTCDPIMMVDKLLKRK